MSAAGKNSFRVRIDKTAFFVYNNNEPKKRKAVFQMADKNDDIYEADVYTLTDEDGVEGQYEEIGVAEVDDKVYHALIPLGEDGVAVGDEYIILREVEDENGDMMLESIEDDEEFDRVADLFDDEFAEIDYDEGADDSDK